MTYMCAVVYIMNVAKETWNILKQRKNTCNSTSAVQTNHRQKIKTCK